MTADNWDIVYWVLIASLAITLLIVGVGCLKLKFDGLKQDLKVSRESRSKLAQQVMRLETDLKNVRADRDNIKNDNARITHLLKLEEKSSVDRMNNCGVRLNQVNESIRKQLDTLEILAANLRDEGETPDPHEDVKNIWKRRVGLERDDA